MKRNSILSIHQIIALTLFSVISFINFSILYSQPTDYSSRGVRSYLVNYNAIKSDYFLTKLAMKRFYLLDEANAEERKLIRKIDSTYLILRYKDVVALNEYLPEYSLMNNNEYSFLHTCDPAGLMVSQEKNWKLDWIADRRFKPNDTMSIAYKLYFALDSAGEFISVDTLIENDEIDIALPKSAKWIKLNTVLNRELELDYSFHQKLYYDDKPMYMPKQISCWQNDKFKGFIQLTIKRLSQKKADSIYIHLDLNANNRFEADEIFQFKADFDTYEFELNDFEIWKDRQYKGGIEFYFIAKSGKDTFRMPEKGYWSTNANNRIRNGTYGFYVMDAGNQDWLNTYIQQVQNSFKEGYNGLFADDTWYKVSNWGVDAFPINYSDSIWFDNITEFISKAQSAIEPMPLFFNGLYSIYALPILTNATGGMTEGFATTHWSGFVHTNYWKELCNIGLLTQKQYNRQWMALGGSHNNNPEMRLYTIASYLLVAESLSLYADAPNYQTFAHYPEFDIPMGKALESAGLNIDDLMKFDELGNNYYSREFENIIVYVNPSNTKQAILPFSKGKNCVILDSLPTVNGGRLFTIEANDTIKPMSAVIILKGEQYKSKLCSPAIKNARINAYNYQSDKIKLTIEVEIADSSSTIFNSSNNMPLHVTADLTQLGILDDLVLRNDGTPASEKYSKYSGEAIIQQGINVNNASIAICAYSTTGIVSIQYVQIKNIDIDDSNMLPNFSFEYDINEDGIPDFWRVYYSGFEIDTIAENVQHGKKSVQMTNGTIDDISGIYYILRLNQTEPKKLVISGWSKADNVSGTKDNNYSLYVDCYYTDDTPLYGQTAQFNVGSHNWEYSEKIIEPTKPIKQLNIYCLFRRHTGTVWYDNIVLKEYTESSVEQNYDLDIIYCEIIPNPIVSNDLKINYLSKLTGEIRIQIYNLVGDLVAFTQASVIEGMNLIELPNIVSKLNNGMYLLRIQGDSICFNKLIISK